MIQHDNPRWRGRPATAGEAVLWTLVALHYFVTSAGFIHEAFRI